MYRFKSFNLLVLKFFLFFLFLYILGPDLRKTLCRCIHYVATFVYIATVILLMFYFCKYYYHRCILITEVNPIKVLPFRCQKFRKLRRFVWFFIIVPYVLRKAHRTVKFFVEFDSARRFERFAFLSYYFALIFFIFFMFDITFDMYWEPEWQEVMYYYYLPEMDIYFTGFDTLAMEYFGLC